MTSTQLLLVDFDGTLCLGDDPVLHYAEAVDVALAQNGLNQQPGATSIRETVAGAFASNTLLVDAIEYHGAGHPVLADAEPTPEDATAHPVTWPLQDGYQLTQLLARQAGLTDAEAGQAFRAGRRSILHRGLEYTDIHAPEGAKPLIAELRRRGVVVALATNSPAEAFTPWLEALGLSESFDAVVNDSRKPVGMPEVLQTLGIGERFTAENVLSLGDIWRNDLAHVDALGGTTVLIDRFATGLGQPTHRVQHFAEAAEVIRTWAGDVNTM